MPAESIQPPPFESASFTVHSLTARVPARAQLMPSPLRAGGTGRGGIFRQFQVARRLNPFPLSPALSHQGRGGQPHDPRTRFIREHGLRIRPDTWFTRLNRPLEAIPRLRSSPAGRRNAGREQPTASVRICLFHRPLAHRACSSPRAVDALPPPCGRDRERGDFPAVPGRPATEPFPPLPNPFPPGERGSTQGEGGRQRHLEPPGA